MGKKEEKKYTIIEGNLLEYPIFSMERRRVRDTVSESVWRQRDITGKVVSDRRFKVSSTYGIPNAFDLDVFNTIMRLYLKGKNEYEKNEVHFTIYEAARELGISIGGRQIDRIRQSLERMSHTTLLFENAFYTERERTTKVVHLIVRFEYYEKRRKDRVISATKVILDDELVSSIERKYFNLIDFDLYKALPGGLPRRLYEYLEKKKYRKNQFEIGVKKLAQRIPLKTKKISQLKGLLDKANEELKGRGVIDGWEYRGNNIVYYFKKSERFKQVEKDLFRLEGLTRTFYESIGQVKIPEELVQQGMAVLQDLIDEGYSREEVEHALGWAVDNVKGVHSIRILPKVIGQALGEQESKELIEKRQESVRKERAEEGKQLEADEKRQSELDRKFRKLPKKEREEIEEAARENLVKGGIKRGFLLDTLVRMERNKILEKRRQEK